MTRDELATEIAAWIEEEGEFYTNGGSWCVYDEEIQRKFHVDIKEDTELVQEILLSFDSELVADQFVSWDGDSMCIEVILWDDAWKED